MTTMLALKILGCIAAYVVIPFIIFPINDWFAGYYTKRFHEIDSSGTSIAVDMNIYTGDGAWIAHLLWPIFAVVFPFMWAYKLYIIRFGRLNLSLAFIF